MMKCDLQRGYCLDGRLPCDLCDCFKAFTRKTKGKARSVINYGSGKKFVYLAPVRMKKYKDVPSGLDKLDNDFPEELQIDETRDSSPLEFPVECKTPNIVQDPVYVFGRLVFKIKKRINGLSQFGKELICQHKGHDWETYAFSTGYFSYDVEQAGHCKRCGFDTHL